MSTPEELLARRRLGLDFTGPLTIERQREYETDVARELDVDSITHLSIEGLHAVGGWPKCAACFTGQYPLPLTHEQKHAIEVNRGEVQRV
jgi:glutamine phosphoribosylpyrophosphate amidotransferase